MSVLLQRPGTLTSFVKKISLQFARRNMSSSGEGTWECLAVSRPSEFVVQVELNRPEKRNSLNPTIWREIGECFQQLSYDEDCRSIVLSGAGKTFCAGLDFGGMGELAAVAQADDKDVSRKAIALRKIIQTFQKSFTDIEKCSKPVIAAIHGGCLGGGLAIATACDIRYASMDAFFSIKEIDIGIAADVGATQRIPKTTGNDSLVRELSYTGRNFHAEEALKLGVISGIFRHREEVLAAALDLAKEIATKSPVAIQGTKMTLNYSRDHGVDESLDYMSVWNAAHLQGEDLVKAAMAAASREKTPPQFAKL